MTTLLFQVKQKKRQQEACDVSRETKRVPLRLLFHVKQKGYNSDLAVSRETVQQNTVLNLLKKINKFVKILLHSQKICGIILFV